MLRFVATSRACQRARQCLRGSEPHVTAEQTSHRCECHLSKPCAAGCEMSEPGPLICSQVAARHAQQYWLCLAIVSSYTVFADTPANAPAPAGGQNRRRCRRGSWCGDLRRSRRMLSVMVVTLVTAVDTAAILDEALNGCSIEVVGTLTKR
jgi:hypothetical protein